jgi:hypothetical protein
LFELLSFELLFAGWFAEAVLRHRLLSAADGVLSGQFCGAVRCGAWAAVLLTSAVLSTRPAKMSLPCDWSAVDRAGRGGAF